MPLLINDNECFNCQEELTAGNRYKIRYLDPTTDSYVLVKYCLSCTRDGSITVSCNECNTRFPYDQYEESIISVVDHRGRREATYCRFEDCYVDHVWRCDTDDRWVMLTSFCPTCNCDQQGNSPYCKCRTTNAVHEYNCEPNTLNFVSVNGDTDRELFMGFELETQIPNSEIANAATYAKDILQPARIAMLKSDGSIGGGFEIVTAPHTYEAHLASTVMWDTVEHLRKVYHARSWDSGTCGLHIHISRKAFANGRHTHRFIEFVYRNSEYMMKYGGRKSDYARFNDVWGFDEYDKPVFTLEAKDTDGNLRGGDKYTAVNTGKRDTLELRFIRGTMNTESVKASLGLAHAMVRYTEDLNSDMANWWDWQTFVDWVNTQPALYSQLIERLPEVPSLVLSELSMKKIDA